MRLIDADALIDRIKNPYEQAQVARWVNEQPTIEQEKRTEERTETHACDCISRQAAIDAVESMLRRKFGIGGDLAEITLAELPSAQPETHEERTETHARDLIERQDAIDALDEIRHVLDTKEKQLTILPSAQPERTCVNCGRTANNGGWYADGGTRCPIEEHYALPKDGYCHLWEKRNVTDDDYPERREE